MTTETVPTLFAQDAATDARALRIAAAVIVRREDSRRMARKMGRIADGLEHLVRNEARCTEDWCIVAVQGPPGAVYHHPSCRRSREYRGA